MEAKYKKMLLLFVTSVAISGLLGSFHTIKAAEAVTRVIGDADNSGVLDVKDLVRYKKVLGGASNASFTEGFASDLNADGDTDSKDVGIERNLLRYREVTRT